MSLRQVKVEMRDLEVGMFISALDKPWAETPFPIQGFLVKSSADISRIRAYCDYVFVDVEKGLAPASAGAVVNASAAEKTIKAIASGAPAKFKTRSIHEKKVARTFPVNTTVYQKSVDLAREIPAARRVMNNLIGCLTLAIRQIGRGNDFNVDQLENSVGDMVDSVIRCPDAFSWLLRLRAKDSQSHDHSMRSALWAIQFGRHIGLDKAQLSDLCLGALLKDVGKIRLDRAILNKANRSPEEEAEYRSFVTLGVEQLQQSGFENRRVLNIIKFHCERLDGSGFPKGLEGARIPFLAAVVGLASQFDSLCNPRETGETLPPSQATGRLYQMRGKQFAEDLVVEFIQSVGLYPPGTIVELTTGDCGMVLEQDPNSRLAPRIAVFDAGKAPSSEDACMFVDLKDEEGAREKLNSFGNKRSYDVAKLGIVRDVEPESFGIEYSLLSKLIERPFNAANDVAEVAAAPAGKGFLSSLRQRFAS